MFSVLTIIWYRNILFWSWYSKWFLCLDSSVTLFGGFSAVAENVFSSSISWAHSSMLMNQIYLIFVYMCVHTCMSMHAYMCMLVWRLEVSVVTLYLTFETESLTAPGTHWLSEPGCCRPRDSLSTPLSTGIWDVHCHAQCCLVSASLHVHMTSMFTCIV